MVANRSFLVGVLVFCGAASCGGGDDSDVAEPTSTVVESTTSSSAPSSTTGTTETDTTQADVTAAYEAATAAFEQAGTIPDPDFPGVFDTHVDPMLNQVRGVLTQLKFEGAQFRFPEPSVRSVEVESFELRDPATAVLHVCVVDDGERYDVASGQLLTDGQPGTTRFTAALQNIDGRWLLAEQTLDEEWLGVAGCAVD